MASGNTIFSAGFGRRGAGIVRLMPTPEKKPPRLEESVRRVARTLHLSHRTEETYWAWIRVKGLARSTRLRHHAVSNHD